MVKYLLFGKINQQMANNFVSLVNGLTIYFTSMSTAQVNFFLGFQRCLYCLYFLCPRLRTLNWSYFWVVFCILGKGKIYCNSIPLKTDICSAADWFF